MFNLPTPRGFARAPFRVAVSAGSAVLVIAAGGFMALPKSPDQSSPAPAAAAIPASSLSAPRLTTAGLTAPIRAAKPADLTCLTKAVYYEARGESPDGQAAVAQVVLNRTHRASYPASVCAVVFQGVNQGGCQFSFVCNGAMKRPLEPGAWSRARSVASSALSGHVMRAVGQAVSFHVAPVAGRCGGVARIGSHVFFEAGRSGVRIASRPSPRAAGRVQMAAQTAVLSPVAAAAAESARDVSAVAPVSSREASAVQ